MDSLHYTASNKNSDLRLRDVSFSSYIKHSAGEDETEINVFDAKKYFSECNDWKELSNSRTLFPAIVHNKNQNISCDLSEINRFSSVSSSDGGAFARNSKATPTASSESSWNSQTGLLSNPPGAVAISLKSVASAEKRRSSASAAAKWFFCRSKCPCSGKKAVQVDDAIKQSNNDLQRIVLEERNHHQKLSVKIQVTPPETGHGVVLSPGLRRSLNGDAPLTAAAGGGFSFPILNPSKMTIKTSATEDRVPPLKESLDAADDDGGSDASSDLFEIESFSTQTTMYRRRDSLERRSMDEPATPSVAATENYPPSEVSIDWSVTTAEGFDRASAANFSSEDVAVKFKGSGGLLSCRHEKAVSVVGPQPIKIVPDFVGPPLISKASASASASGLGSVHVSGGRPPKPNKPPLAATHSARLSLAFAA